MKKLLSLMLLLPGIASALDYTLMVGDTHANLQPAGVWWVQDYAHSLPSNAPSFTFRADQRFGKWGVGGGFMYIGHFSSLALAKGSDAAAAAGTPYPVTAFVGNESIEGIFLNGRRYFGNFYAEVGAIVTRTNWTMDVPQEYPAIPSSGGMTPYGYSEFVHIAQLGEIQLMPMADIGYIIDKHWSAQFAMLPTRVYGQYQGITKGYSWNASVGYTF